MIYGKVSGVSYHLNGNEGVYTITIMPERTQAQQRSGVGNYNLQFTTSVRPAYTAGDRVKVRVTLAEEA